MNAVDIKILNANVVENVDERGRAFRWAMVALGCLTVAFWILIHPYRGIIHDSTLYTVLALSRLHPAALGHDLFVRYGAQDHYTIFGPIYAAAIRAFGLEPGAAVLACATQAAFFGAAWLLARRLMSAGEALLAIGLLVVLPSWYGSNSVFAYVEAFVTPRQSAEAFALAGIAAVLYNRRVVAGGCMIAALLLHPIIALAGVTLWIMMVSGPARPWPTTIAIGVLATLLVGLSATGVGPFAHFDAAWFDILQDRLAYLFPTRWKGSEWLSEGIHAAVLIVGARYCSSQVIRRLCIAAVITVALGMAFAVVESDWLRVILAGQMQTWRWLWLLGVLSVMLLPRITMDCWRGGGLGRVAAILLLSAWITRSDTFAVIPVLLACLAALVPGEVRDARQLRLINAGAYILLGVSLIILAGYVYDTLPELKVIRAGHRPYMVRIGEAQALSYGGLLPAALLAVVWRSASRINQRGAVLLAAMGAVLLLSLMPFGMIAWSTARFPEDKVQAFAPWRAAIPESADILWPDPPPIAWFELGRASYWSLYQMSGLVFSRDVTMISIKREAEVAPVLPMLARPSGKIESGDSPQRTLASSPCDVPGITFYASWTNLGPTPYPAVAPDVNNPKESLYLYHCDSPRR